MSGQSLGKRLSNLKSVALTVLELAFDPLFKLVRLTVPLRTHRNTDKFFQKGAWPGSRDPLNFWALSANSSKTVKATSSNEHIISAIHFVHLAEIIILLNAKIYPNPSMEQTTRASVAANPLSHTVPHSPSRRISRRPSRILGPPASLTVK